ncbi:MAG: hypothetical protein ACHQ16_04285, partial [Candidatus Lutacidiplasmatales archaeon]
MRYPRLVAIGVALVFVAVAFAPSGGPATAGRLSTVLPENHAAAAPPTPFPSALANVLRHNVSWTSPDVGPPPVSAIPETPPPPLPATTPKVVYVVNATRGCCGYVNQTPAGGPWDAV